MHGELCEVDHLTEWSDDGRTDSHNGGPRCGAHNRHKHRAGWRTVRVPTGGLVDHRADGTPVITVGRRLARSDTHNSDDDPDGDNDNDSNTTATSPQRRSNAEHSHPDGDGDVDGNGNADTTATAP